MNKLWEIFTVHGVGMSAYPVVYPFSDWIIAPAAAAPRCVRHVSGEIFIRHIFPDNFTGSRLLSVERAPQILPKFQTKRDDIFHTLKGETPIENGRKIASPQKCTPFFSFTN